MKKILIALGFTFAAMSSQAALTFTPVGSTVFTNGENNVHSTCNLTRRKAND